MKKKYLILATVVFLIIIFFMVFRAGGEDFWIKDKKGVWVKHGNPLNKPDYASKQQSVILCADDLYNTFKSRGNEFSSQCLGDCGDYAVDIVHVPRISEDNNPENQCPDYKNKIVNNFIELDKNGEIVSIG